MFARIVYIRRRLVFLERNPSDLNIRAEDSPSYPNRFARFREYETPSSNTHTHIWIVRNIYAYAGEDVERIVSFKSKSSISVESMKYYHEYEILSRVLSQNFPFRTDVSRRADCRRFVLFFGNRYRTVLDRWKPPATVTGSKRNKNFCTFRPRASSSVACARRFESPSAFLSCFAIDQSGRALARACIIHDAARHIPRRNG